MDNVQKSTLQQKIVLISGATSGFGWETALMLARNGYRVFAGYRNQARGNELLNEAKKSALPLSIVRLDVTKPDTLHQAVETVIREIGRIDVLINNAGYGFAGAVEDLEMDEVRAQFETNVFGHLELTQAVIPHMRRERRGLIMNISSMSGRISYPLFSAYCASKHALEAFGEALRYELRPFGIFSVLVEPGVFKTSFVNKNLAISKKTMSKDSPYYQAAKDAHDYYTQEDKKAPGPEIVANKILKILQSKRPRLRYPIGIDSRAVILLKKILPASWFEAIFIKYLGVDRYK